MFLLLLSFFLLYLLKLLSAMASAIAHYTSLTYLQGHTTYLATATSNRYLRRLPSRARSEVRYLEQNVCVLQVKDVCLRVHNLRVFVFYRPARLYFAFTKTRRMKMDRPASNVHLGFM
jgi:hypothetical protein